MFQGQKLTVAHQSKRNRRNRVSWTRLERSIQQSPAEVLVFVDRHDTLSPHDMEGGENSDMSPQTNVPLDSVQGKLELIDSHQSAATDACSFVLQLSRALQQAPGSWYNVQDLSMYLKQQEGLGSVRYRNLSSLEDGESLVLDRIATLTDVITFTFDITITTTTNLEEDTLSEQILDWCLSSPSAVIAMSLSTHRSAKRMRDGESTNLLTLRVEAPNSEPTMSSLAQWSKRAPDRLLVSSGQPFHTNTREPATQPTKSPRVSNDLTAWVKQRNQISQLTAASSTRQGYYGKVLVLPIRWENSGFDAKGEIGLLRSVLKDHFTFKIEADLVLQSHGDAQGQLRKRIDKYIRSNATEALASQDLLVVIYNGHGADPFDHKAQMIIG